jgi:flagellar FliL protein
MSEDTKAPPAKKKSRLKLLLLVVVSLLLLASGGAGAYFWMSRQSAEAAPAVKHEEPKGKAVALPTFTVNLADKEGSRYLRTTLALIVADEDKAEELTEPEHASSSVELMRARSEILELLSTRTAAEITSAEGKDALKQAIAERASKAFGSKVTDVLFSEFVVQF